MLTLTRSGLTLNLNASVVPATGSSNVPILYMEEVSDDYTGYLVEPRIGFTQNGKYTEFIGTYEEETQSVIIPAQCFANTGSVDITIALIDPEDPDHVEVCTPKKFSVTKAPMGTVVLPEEPTWQDYVLNYMKQNLDKLQGPQGDKGEPGDNATINVGAVTTLEPGQEATVTNTGSETNAVLAFGIPKGVQGATGPQGPQGAPGVNENVLHSDIFKSENPSVDDAYEVPFQNLKLYGKSTQESTTGKNLFDISKVTTKENPNGTGIVNNGDGTLTITNSAGDSSVLSDQKLSDVCPSLQIGETYTLSGLSSVNTAAKIYLTEVKLAWLFGSSKTITQDMLDSYVRFYAEEGGNTDTVSNLQIEKGSTATAYEPYTGGAPSPNPDYPQEITKIEEVDCNVVGKNLYDPSQYQNYTGTKGMTIQYNSDEDYFILNGTCTETAAFADYSFLLKANATNYTLSCEYLSGDFSIPDSGYLVAYVGKSADGTDPYEHVNYIGTPNITKQTVQQTGLLDMPYIDDFWFYITDGVTCNNLKVRVQLEVGKTATAYEPHQSQHVQFTPPAPLYSLLDGSVADYVDVARGKYVYKLKKATVTSSNIDSLYDYGSYGYGFYFRLGDKVTGVSNSGICREIKTGIFGDVQALVFSDTTYLYAIHMFESAKTVDETKQWLDEISGLNIVYQLATPTEQDIPAETLEALQALKTFNGVTNIFCNAPVSAQYEQSVQIVINKILEQLNKLQTQTLNLQEEMINNV